MSYNNNPTEWVGRVRPALGEGTMTPELVEQRYATYLESSAKVENPWWEDPERVAGTARQLGLVEDAPAGTVRRALFDRRYGVSA